jgi:hypothetical protein
MRATPENVELKFQSSLLITRHKWFSYAIVEAILLSGAKPTKGGHASQQVSQAVWRQISACNIQLL